MDFTYTPQQQRLRAEVRAFALEHVAPFMLDWDDAAGLPLELAHKLGERGYLGTIFPREYGGQGWGYVEYCIVIEELARIDPSVGLFVASHTSLCSNHLYLAGTEEQRRRFLPKLATGEWVGCWSFTEPNAGSDAQGMCTVGVAEQDHWVLNGTKRFTTNAEIASLAVVIAVTDPEAPKNKISAFIVEKGTPGLRVGERVRTLGMRGCRTSSVHYENCRIPGDQLLGERGQGFIDCLRVLDGGRISIAALSVGIAQGAYDIADAYARQRRQFNQAIIEFQAIQHKLVDMHVDTVASRLLTYQAAEAKNSGGRVSKEAAMAKLFASEACVRVADQAVQILGGNGLVRDYKAEKFLRDAKLCTIGEGTSEIMKLVIGRHLQPTPEQQPALTGVQQS